MKDIQQIRRHILEAISHLEKRFLEREELIRLLFLGAMGGENILLVGLRERRNPSWHALWLMYSARAAGLTIC